MIDLTYPEPTSKAAALYATHTGRSNFIVVGYKNGERTDGYVNVIGAYEGTVLIDSADQLQIKADGPWRVELRPLFSQPQLVTHAEGHGDQVLVYLGSRGVLALTHDGTSNFIVHSITSRGSNGLVNEIGPYTGKVPLAAGPGFIEVLADGNWTLDIT